MKNLDGLPYQNTCI